MPEPYDLTYLGNPVLKQQAQEIKDPTSKEVQDIIARLMDTIDQDKMLGLAAPQWGQSIRMFIFQSQGPRAGEDVVPLTVVINPEIISHSDETYLDYEGCLSLPLLIENDVPRFSSINCKYTTPEGKVVRKTLRGLAARVFQHEFDHLNGVLAIDHTDDIIFAEGKKSIEEVLGVKTGKELSDSYNYNPDIKTYEKKSPVKALR